MSIIRLFSLPKLGFILMKVIKDDFKMKHISILCFIIKGFFFVQYILANNSLVNLIIKIFKNAMLTFNFS